MIDVCTYASVEKGRDEGLCSLSDDVIVEVLNIKRLNICAIIDAVS